MRYESVAEAYRDLEAASARLELGEQLPAPLHRKGADHPGHGQLAVIGVQPQQQRPDQVGAALVEPVAGDHAVGGAGVLDLAPDPSVGLVHPVEGLGDQAVQAGALEP